MRLLHVFPLFGSELTNGSDYYAYMLTKHLARLGNEVDVFATRSKAIRPGSAFCLQWRSDYSGEPERQDNISIYRFGTTLSVPYSLGHFVSRRILRRWEREERLFGRVTPGSRNLVGSYRLRALARPRAYDWLAMLGRGPWSLSLMSRVLKTISNYDLVLVGFVPFALVAQIACIANYRQVPVAVLALFHPEDVYHHFRSIYKSLARADLVLAQTAYSETLLKTLAPGSNPIVVGAGVDDALFSGSEVDGSRFRHKYGLAGKFVVLSVGRKELGKGYRRLIEAIDLLNDEDVVLVLIGADVDGLRIESPRVLYLGQVSRHELIDAYAACDVFALLSEYESFGMVFLEAWMMKKPVIGYVHCKPVATIIQDGTNGFLCESPKAVAQRIVELIGNQTLRDGLGEAGYALVTQQYTWSQVAARVSELYAGVVSRSRKQAATFAGR